jgi:hypothetical protein
VFAPESDSKPYELAIFDLRIPGATERYWSERAAWREYADVEALDEHHYVLIIRPGLAREKAA